MIKKRDVIIQLGGVAATAVNQQSSTSLTVTTPAHIPGIVTVTATLYDDQSASLINAYEFANGPSITSVSPGDTFTTGGDTVTISGSNFLAGSKVRLDDIYVSDTTIINTTSLTFVVPARALSGSVDVTVEDSFGQAATLTNAFTYHDPTPVISSISPNQGPVGGSQSVTITGQNFTVGVQEVSNVSSGANHSCGIYDSQAYCWGINTYGQLGNNSTNASSVPVAVDTSGVLAGKTILSIEAGDGQTCAIASDNQAYCWGYNAQGQLGINSTTTSYKPVAVTTTGVLAGKTISSITTGGNHTCAIASDNQAYCWGYNAQGQLGNNSTTTSSSPVAVATTGVLNGKTVSSITTGANHTCVVASDNLAYCWGFNTYGQLGNNSTAQSAVPVAVDTYGSIAGKTISSIAAGASHTCVVASDNQAHCWGDGGSGQLGNNSTTTSSVPVAAVTTGVLNGKTVSSITTGANHTCVVASDNLAYCWGYNPYGQLGNNSTTRSAVPVAVTASGVLAGKKISSLTGGGNYTCASTIDKQAYCWGYNIYGQLGDNTTTNSSVAVATRQVPVGNPTVTIGGSFATNIQVTSSTSLIATTPSHSAGFVDVSVVRYDGLSGTQSNAYEFMVGPTITGVAPATGQTIGGDTITITGSGFSDNVTVTFNKVAASALTRINDSTLTVTTPASTAGTRDVIVHNSDGQTAVAPAAFTYLEPNPTITSITPNAGSATGGQAVTITGQNFSNGAKEVSQIVSGATHSCGIYDGQAYCWGLNNYGQLGNNSTNASSVPVAVDASGVLAGKTILSIETGDYHTCVIASDNQAYCWGYNAQGQLGNNSTNNSSVPVAVVTTGVLAGKTILSIAVGDYHTCVVASDNQTYCWGNNAQGQLGNNSTGQSTVPVATTTTGALAGKTVISITAGTNHTCAIASDNQAYCWGYNGYGQLGNNSTTQSTVPVAVVTTGVLNGKTVSSITAGANHTCVVASDNLPYCWGYNAQGQLGNNSTTQSSVPVAVVTTGVLNGKTVSSITAGTNHTCAIASDNQAYCWGYNGNGQLGNNSTTQSTTPAAVDTSGVLAGKTVSQITAGGNYTCAIASDYQAYCWGINTNGQLGNNSKTDASTPVAASIVTVRAIAVLFDNQAATNVQLQSPTTITAVAPAHTAGTVDVAVNRYDNKTTVLAASYTYVGTPTIASVSPNTGSIEGGNTVTVNGTNFHDGIRVKVGGIYAASVTLISDTSLSFVVPEGVVPGSVDVMLEDTFGKTATLTAGYTYQLPTQTITSITPTIGSMSGGTRVTITGTGFAAKSDGGTWYSVTFGGTQATAVTYINDTTLQATTPAHALGVVDVSVTSAYTNAATLTSAFTYTAAAYVFSNAPLTVAATEPGKLTIQARNDSGNPVTSPVDTTIDVTSSSTGASFARNLSEDESTRWSYSSVVIPAGKSSVDIWYKDTKQGTPTITGVVQGGATFTQSATVNPPYKLKVTGVSDPIQAGTPSSVTVQVVDYAGASLAGYTGTISFSSTDLAAGLPAEYTMTSADRGIKTFVNGVTMGTTGEFCVTATDTTQSSITGQQCNISVASANAGTITKLAIISPTQNFPLGASSSAITIQAQGADSSPIPVSTATTIYVYANSTTGEFSSDQTTWSGTKPFAITIPAGQTAANVYYRDTAARTTTISARDMTSDTADAKSGDYGWVNATQDIVSGTGAAANLVITGKPTLLINEHGRYTIELQDSGGNAVTASSDTVVRIGSSSATTSFYLPNAPTTALSGTVDVTIPGGSMRTTVDMSDSVASSGTTMNTLTVVDGRANTETARLIDGSAAIQIVAAYPANIVTTTSAPSTEAGSPLAMTVQLTDANGVAAPATSDMTVALSSSSKSGQFSLSDSPFTPITSLQFARGVSSATLYYRDTLVGSANLQASQSGLQTTGAPVEVTSSAPVKFGVIGDAKVPLDTSSNAFTVTSYDIYGNVAIQNNSTPVYLYSDQSSTQFASSTSGPWTASSVTIAPGQSSAQFYLKDNTFHVNQITASDTAPLDQPDTGMVNGTQQVTITSQVIASVVVTSAVQSIVAGQASQAIDIALRQADGSPALQDGTTDISLTATEGHFIATQNLNDPTINSKVVTRGTATTSFYFTGEKAGSHTMTVSASPTARATQPITITAAETASMDFISGAQSVKSGAASSPLRINFNDTYGNNTTSGSDRTIALSSTCAAGTFSESDTNWLATSTIAVAAASTDATFYYKDTSAGTCTISVTTNSLTSASQPITITATAPTRLSITGSLQSMIKGQPRSLAINLLDASGNIVPAETQTVVYLQTSSSGGKFDQASVTFESGTSTRTVTYTDTVAGQATITARDQADPTDAEGSLTDTAVTVDYSNGTPSVIAFGAPTSTMKAGDTQALTLSLRNEYNEPTTTASPLTLTLNSTNTSGAFLDSAATDANTITTLTIPAGEGAAALYYHQTQSSSATVTASAQGLKSGAATLTILPDSVHEARFTNSSYVGSNALEIGQSGALTATLYDIYGNVATTDGDVTLYAQSDAPSGSFSDNGQMTIPAAGSSATIQYTQDLAGRYTITADDTPTPSDTQGLRSFTQTGEVINGAPSSFQFDRSSLSLERGGVTDATQVTLLNAHGRIVAAPSGGQTVQLSMLTGTGTFSTAPNGSFSSTLDLKVEAGKTSAQFYYRNDNAQIETRDCTPVVDDSRTCTTSTTNSHRILGAVTTDDTSSSKALTAIMSYGAPTRFAFTTPSRQHEANRPSPIMTVERQNQYGKPVPLHSNTTLYLRSSAQSGQFGSSKIKWGVNTVTILDSNASVSFYYKDGGTGTPTITAADTLPLSPDLNIVNATQTATILPATSTPPPVASFHVTNISDPQKQGTHSSAVVLPLDADGYVVNSYSGTISFTSSDSDAILPDTYTFNPEVDMGSKTFTNEIAFATAGEKTVTVTDGDGKTGSQTDITVTDGNTSAVSAIALTQPASPVTIIRNAASQNITFELHDTDGQPTNAPIGGMPVRLTSSAPTGKFALKPGGPWVSNLVVTVPAGLSFGNFYYMDSQLGKVILSATDWAGAADSTAVANGKLEAVIQSIGIDGDSIVMSRNVFGVLEPSKYLFAHDAAGSIQGQIHNIFNSLNLETNTTTPVSWRTQLRQGVKLLLTNSMSDTSSASIQKDDTTTVAGQPDFYATAEATDTTFDNPDEVVSRQYTIPTSPWKASISSVSPLAMQPNLAFASNAFNDITAAMVSFYQRNALTAPSTAVIKLLNANATDASQPIYTWGATSPNSTVAFTVPANLIANDTAYRIFVATFDSDGYTTAQALSAPLTLRQTATLPPTITGPPATNDPMPNNESPAIKNGDDTTSVTPTTDLANKQPDEIVQNRPNKVKGTPHSAAGALPSAAIAAGDFNLESQIAATYIGTTVVLVLLLREAYKEIARIRRNRAIIRREQQLAADRDTFLALSGHYLRTPISILDAAASMAPAAQQSLRPIINTLNEKANTLLQSSTQRIAAETAPVPTMRHAYLSVFFWLPILLSIGLSYAVVSLLAAASAGTAPDDFQVYTGIILAALALAAFFGTRVIYINNEREKMSRILQKHQEELFQAKNVFMAGMRNEIAMELRALHEIKAQQILPAQIAALIDDGVQRLDSLVAKIGLATQISTMPTTPEQFTAEQLIHPLVQQRSAAIEDKKLRLIQRHTPAILVQDKRLLGYVINALIDNAIKFNRTNGRIEITTQTHKRGRQLIVTITNTTNALVDTSANMENLFKPFNHTLQGDDLTADGAGLSLYLDKIIVEHMGGSIKAERSSAYETSISFIIPVKREE
jgi:alpha-tubulin suppressor-like RCC1 family protein/signal transduction histidine kinase